MQTLNSERQCLTVCIPIAAPLAAQIRLTLKRQMALGGTTVANNMITTSVMGHVANRATSQANESCSKKPL